VEIIRRKITVNSLETEPDVEAKAKHTATNI